MLQKFFNLFGQRQVSVERNRDGVFTYHFLDSNGFINRSEGIMGPMYGFQWRHFNGNYNEETGESNDGIDQLKDLINLLGINVESNNITELCNIIKNELDKYFTTITTSTDHS